MSATPMFTVAQLAEKLDASFTGDGAIEIRGLAAVHDGRPGDLTFITAPKYAALWAESRASAAVVAPGVDLGTDHRPRIIVENVDLAMIAMLEAFAPPADEPPVGVHPKAFVDPTARIGRDVRIGPFVMVSAGVRIGDLAVLNSGVCIHAGAEIGERSVLHAHVVVRERCVIGRNVVIHQNASIGADGFGYRPSPTGAELLKMPHIGNVVIEDNVEIGAGTCIDRAKFGSTVIGAGTKIDNLCQIAHNVRIGRMCVMAALNGISGSVTIGDGCMLGGQVGVAEHVTIGSGAQIAARSGVISDVPPRARVAGGPAVDARQAFREFAAIRRLPEVLRQLQRLKVLSDSADPDKRVDESA